MSVQAISQRNNQNNYNPNFKGKLLGSGFDILEQYRIDKLGKTLNAMVEEAPCDLIILQNKRKGIVRIIAQKAEDFNKKQGTYTEVTLPVRELSEEEYLNKSRSVIEQYKEESFYKEKEFFKKIYTYLKNKINPRNN